MTEQETPPKAPVDFHHVTLNVSKVSRMELFRNEHQLIKAIIDAKLDVDEARKLLKILAEQIAVHQDGMGPITFSLEGDFT